MSNHADTKCQTVPTQNGGHADTKCQTMTTEHTKPCRHKMPYYADTKCQTMSTQCARPLRHKIPDHADIKCQGEGDGRRHENLVRTLRPAKIEETVSRHQNISVKEVGTPPVRSNLCTPLIAVRTAVRSKVTKTMSKKQQLRNN